MAIQKNTKKETPKKEKREIKWIQDIRTFVKNETVQFITGLFCVMIGAYMALAFSSFILNGGIDQSALEQPGITEQVSQAEQTNANSTNDVQNATGRSGAKIAKSLVILHCSLPHHVGINTHAHP